VEVFSASTSPAKQICRWVVNGIGAVGVRQPRVRDRVAAADDRDRVGFRPATLPAVCAPAGPAQSLPRG
jgi:hypothetical protein